MLAIGLDIGGSSIKGAVLIEGHTTATARSDAYTRPDQSALGASLPEVLNTLLSRIAIGSHKSATRFPVGVCLPGAVEPSSGRVRGAVNLPSLVGVEIESWLESVLSTAGLACERSELMISTDASAAAVDLAYEPGTTQPYAGRLAAISIGTGVGLGVVDAGEPLRVDGDSAGHLGQVDVAVPLDEGMIPIGPDDGRGSLEAYCTAPALRDRFGPRWADRIAGLPEDDPCLVALARAIRIVHAIYRPGIITIAGGVGLLLAVHAERLARMINADLTSAADPGWSLRWAVDTMHAAAGAARIAATRTTSAHACDD